MIKPTIGRVVLFTPNYQPGGPEHRDQPLVALICYVWSDNLVNLGGFDANGVPFAATSVTLLQDDQPKLPLGHYAEWMPYQKGQAAKVEELEAKLKA